MNHITPIPPITDPHTRTLNRIAAVEWLVQLPDTDLALAVAISLRARGSRRADPVRAACHQVAAAAENLMHTLRADHPVQPVQPVQPVHSNPVTIPITFQS